MQAYKKFEDYKELHLIISYKNLAFSLIFLLSSAEKTALM
jgi:hypothetical protein